jgi:hypothetical protein
MTATPKKAARAVAPVEISAEDRAKQMAALDPEAAEPAAEPAMQIAKPAKSGLDAFKSKRAPTIAGVETLLAALPLSGISEAKDWVRLHPDAENYWSQELCFVGVPIKGDPKDQLHLIAEDLAMAHLPSGRIQRFRLALASKPDDRFFLCRVPSQNLDNSWNRSNHEACEKAQRLWTMATSRKAEGIDHYKVEMAEPIARPTNRDHFRRSDDYQRRSSGFPAPCRAKAIE